MTIRIRSILIAIVFCSGWLVMLAEDAPKPEAPTLTTEQKLSVREAQLAVSQLTAQKAQLESQYRDVVPALEKAQKALETKVAELTPKGFVLQGDLTLKLEEKPILKAEEKPKPEPAKPQAP